MNRLKFLAVMALLVVAVFAFGGIKGDPVFADDATSGPTWNNPDLCGEGSGQAFNEYLNESGMLNHTHDVEGYDDPIGVGADIVVIENTGDKALFGGKFFKAVELQTRYDAANRGGSAFIVGQFNVFELLNKKKE